MPIEDVLSRLTEIAALASRVSDPATMRAAAGDFSTALARSPAEEGPVGFAPDALPWMAGGASAPLLTSYAPVSYAPVSYTSFGGSPTLSGLRTLTAAAGEVGVQEEPPGSNDGPRIAQYRAATAGAAGTPGRWCAYFVSWAAAQAGAPLGDYGQGLGSVSQIEDWARRSGRLVPPGEPPRPGDLILFGTAHVGIVESVGPGSRLTTVEGNHDDRVERVERSASEATGFVRLA